jgi:hypothetical protein
MMPARIRDRLEEPAPSHLEQLTKACADLATAMMALVAEIRQGTAETHRRLAALERTTRGYSWPQIVLLGGILVTLIWIAAHLPR